MSDTEQAASDLVEQFSEHLDLEQAEVKTQLDELTGEYSLPLDEARRSLRNKYMEKAGLDTEDILQDREDALVGEINEDELWVDLRVKVEDLWEPNHDSMSQVGLLGDESGTIKFTSFKTSDLPDLDEGKSYKLQNVVSDEYNGSYSVKLNKTTEITELDEDIEVGDDSIEYEGVLIDIQSGSGLIKRCPNEDCTRVLDSSRCAEHGDVDDHEFDLRIKGVLDDGDDVCEVIFDKEMTESATGYSLEDAKELAKQEYDTTVVAERMADKIHSQFFHVTGPRIGQYLLVNDYERTKRTDADAVAEKVRSI